MKKRLTALLFVLLLLGSFVFASEPVQQEPDTGTQTQTRVLGENQKVEYRFHTSIISPWDKGYLYLHLFDKEVETYNQADNWTSTWLGETKNSIQAEHSRNAPEDSQWKTSTSLGSHWKSILPGGSVDKVKEMDVVLTLARKGKTVKISMKADGRTWEAQRTIGNMTNEKVYFYIRPSRRMISGVEFRDLGEAGLLLPGWLRFFAIMAALAGAFGLHVLANKWEFELYTTGGIFPPTTGLFVCLGTAVLLFFGRSRPDLLSNLTKGYISFRLPAGGLGFWIPMVIAVLGTLGFLSYLDWLALRENGRLSVYILCAPLLGLLHAVWIAAIIIVFLQLIGQIFQLLVAIAFIICLYIAGGVMDFLQKNYKEVVTTTRVYNSVGNLVSYDYDVSYEKMEDKDKK